VVKYMRKCRQVNLEKIGLSFKHADYLIDCEDLLVVIEETSVAKLEDINKLEETINWLCENRKSASNYIGIIHRSKAADPHLPKLLNAKMQSLQRQKKPIIYKIATCNENLRYLLSEYDIMI
jgi:hypothetical protein